MTSLLILLFLTIVVLGSGAVHQNTDHIIVLATPSAVTSTYQIFYKPGRSSGPPDYCSCDGNISLHSFLNSFPITKEYKAAR